MATKQNRKVKTLSAAGAKKLWSDFEASPAQIDAPTVEHIEHTFSGKGRTRRAGLALLTMSGKELAEAVKDRDEAVTLAEVAICAGEYRKWLVDFARLMETAHVRVSVALCNRDDMEAVMRDAEARLDAGDAGDDAEIPAPELAAMSVTKRELLEKILLLRPHVRAWIMAAIDAVTSGDVTTGQLEALMPTVYGLDSTLTPQEFVALIKVQPTAH